MNPKVAIIRGKFLNRYEMQFFEPLIADFDLTAFGSMTAFHDRFAFPTIKLLSPVDLPDFPYKMPVLNRLFVDAHYLFGLEGRLRGFDLVHSAEAYFHYTQQALNAKKKGYVKKVIATVLENIPFNNERIRGRRAFKTRARNELDHIIALTNKTREVLLVEGADPEKITVISHFIDTKRFHPAQKKKYDKTVTILFVGRMEEEKGVLDLLSAARLLAGDGELRHRAVHWLFVGSGTKKNEVERTETISNLKMHVHTKCANYSEMPDIYRRADIFVAPSKPRIQKVRGEPTPIWLEQYNTALLEAQASGLPIVTTKTGGIPENIGDAGVLVPPGDIQKLSVAIKRFILDPKSRREYGKKARQRAELVHAKEIGAKKLRDLYRKLLGT